MLDGPVLFTLFFALVLEKWRGEMGSVCPDHAVSFHFNISGNLFNHPCTPHQSACAPDLEFADDAVLIACSQHAAETALITFASVATFFGLTVNLTKTKFMGCGPSLTDVDCLPISIGTHSVQHVDSFTYLGSLLSPDARYSLEIDRRLGSASGAFSALQWVFKNNSISLRTKRLIYSVCVYCLHSCMVPSVGLC